MFTSGSDILLTGLLALRWLVSRLPACAGVRWGRVRGRGVAALGVLVVDGSCRDAGFPAWLGWPGCSAGEFTASFAGARLLLTAGGVACVFLAGLAGGQDALVAHDHEAGKPEHERGDAGQADPAAADAGGGGVL